MTSGSSEQQPRPESDVDEEDISPGDLVIELIDGVPHVYTEPEN